MLKVMIFHKKVLKGRLKGTITFTVTINIFASTQEDGNVFKTYFIVIVITCTSLYYISHAVYETTCIACIEGGRFLSSLPISTVRDTRHSLTALGPPCLSQ